LTDDVAVLDSDTLSELSRGNARVATRARAYLERHGRLTITAVSVFERLRGYRLAIDEGKPYEPQLRQFQALAAHSIVLPFDDVAADRAAAIWAALRPKLRRAIGDILIAAIASAHGLRLVTGNQRDFAPIAQLDFTGLRLLDWSR
jgi:predicted nucleic acid-binding protein